MVCQNKAAVLIYLCLAAQFSAATKAMARIIFTIIVFVAYNILVLYTFGFPKHLSGTYRLLGNYKRWLRLLFPFFILLQFFLFVPIWWDMAKTISLEYPQSSSLVLVTAFMMLIIAFSGNYHCNKWLLYTHYIAAIIAGISAVMWIFWISQFWFLPLCNLIAALTIAYLTKTLRSSFLYWIELVGFCSLYVVVLLMEIYL